MASVTITHDLECSEDTFWDKAFFDEPWNHEFYLNILKFPGWKLLELKRGETGVERKVHIDPPLTGLPSAVTKIVGDRFSYTEEGKYEARARRYDFVVTPSALPEKTKAKGYISTKATGAESIARTAHLEVDVKVFVVGSLLEEKILSDFRRSAEEAAIFTKRFLKEHGLR